MDLSNLANDLLKPICTDLILSGDPETFFGFLLLDETPEYDLLLEDGGRIQLE